MSGEEIHRRVVEVWDKYDGEPQTEDQLAQFLKQTVIFDQLTKGNINSVIFSYQTFKIFYISEPAAAFYGASVADILEKGISLIYAKWEDTFKEVSMKATALQAERVYNATKDELLRTSVTIANLKIKTDKGIPRRALIQTFPITFSKDDKPLLGMSFIYDTTPFIDNETWWYRSQVGDKIRTYQSHQGVFKEQDIISDREKEVLKCLAKGMTSKEISEHLFISVNTVDNHRRNMLQRTGANDTSCLIYICKACGIL
jgi:DNA-binding CsgD family transcriptional regulator